VLFKDYLHSIYIYITDLLYTECHLLTLEQCGNFQRQEQWTSFLLYTLSLPFSLTLRQTHFKSSTIQSTYVNCFTLSINIFGDSGLHYKQDWNGGYKEISNVNFVHGFPWKTKTICHRRRSHTEGLWDKSSDTAINDRCDQILTNILAQYAPSVTTACGWQDGFDSLVIHGRKKNLIGIDEGVLDPYWWACGVIQGKQVPDPLLFISLSQNLPLYFPLPVGKIGEGASVWSFQSLSEEDSKLA